MKNNHEIAKNILSKKPNIRESIAYEKEQDTMIELTMSCDKAEAIGYMSHWMNKAVNDINYPNSDLETKFISAYDLHCSLETL